MLDANDGFGLRLELRLFKKGILQKRNLYDWREEFKPPRGFGKYLLPAAKKGFAALGFTHADSLQLTFGGKNFLERIQFVCCS